MVARTMAERKGTRTVDPRGFDPFEVEGGGG
jgi:hypothetical protein